MGVRGVAMRIMVCIALPACVDGGGGIGGLPGAEDDVPEPPADSGVDPHDDGPVVSPSTAERYAQVRCAAMTTCDCEYQPFANLGDCERIMGAGFRQLQYHVGDAAIDVACFESLLALLQAAPCGLAPDLIEEAIIPTCFVYRGEGELDTSCFAHDGVLTHADTCRPGLSCRLTIEGYRCRPDSAVEPTVAAGDPCGTAQVAEASCGPGMYCDPDSLQCAALREEGEVCNTFKACASGTWCHGDPASGTAICRALAAPGEMCSVSAGCEATACGEQVCVPGLCAQGECTQPQPLVCHPSEI